MPVLYLIYKLWIGFVFWLTLLLLYPFFYLFLSNKRWFGIAFKLKRFWSLLIRVLIFCPISIEYKNKSIKEFNSPYLICSNHGSYLDTVFMYAVVPHYFLFVGKGELLKWPLFKLFFKQMDIPIDRENFRNAKMGLNKVSDALKDGNCVAIYPEGTIPMSAPKMGGFKSGAFKISKELNVPILPITWKDNYRVLNDLDNLWSKNGPRCVHAVVHELIYPDDFDEKSLKIKVKEKIESGFQ